MFITTVLHSYKHLSGGAETGGAAPKSTICTSKKKQMAKKVLFLRRASLLTVVSPKHSVRRQIPFALTSQRSPLLAPPPMPCAHPRCQDLALVLSTQPPTLPALPLPHPPRVSPEQSAAARHLAEQKPPMPAAVPRPPTVRDHPPSCNPPHPPPASPELAIYPSQIEVIAAVFIVSC